MMSRRVWVRRGFWAALAVLAGQQAWRHGRDYVFADQFAVVVPGRIYRGAWQQPWPMRRVVTNYKIKTVLALAHPANHPLAVREKAMAGELGYRWVHIPIVDHRVDGVLQTVIDQLDRAAAVLADPANQPVYFHCHHGINRASMVQMAYRTKYCGWTLEEATAEIARTYGLIEVAHGPDYRKVERFYKQRVLPNRPPGPTATAARRSATSAVRF
jgi:Tyrosine phosphatase family